MENHGWLESKLLCLNICVRENLITNVLHVDVSRLVYGSYIRPGWESKVTSFTISLHKNTTEQYVSTTIIPLLHVVLSVLGYYHANHMAEPEGVATRCNQRTMSC